MISDILKWIFYAIPWQAQLALLAIPVLAAFYLAIRVFGYERVKAFILPAVAILAALGLLGRAKQQGYADRKDIQKKAQDNALNDFNQTKQQVDEKPISQVDRDNQPWIKP